MFNYINSLDSSSLIYLAKQYANLEFSKQEIDPILPFLKSVYIDYCKNKDKRELYKNQLKQLTNDVTYNKLLILLNKFNLK